MVSRRRTTSGIFARARQYAPLFLTQAGRPKAKHSNATRATAARQERSSSLWSVWESDAQSVTAGV